MGCGGGKKIVYVVCGCDLLVRVMSSWPKRSFMDSGRYFSTQGNCRCSCMVLVVVLEDDEEEDELLDDMATGKSRGGFRLARD